MPTVELVDIGILSVAIMLILFGVLRTHREARRSIEKFICRQGMTIVRLERQWFNMGPFGTPYERQCVFRATVLDPASNTLVAWVKFDLDLFGNVHETETKFENANRY